MRPVLQVRPLVWPAIVAFAVLLGVRGRAEDARSGAFEPDLSDVELWGTYRPHALMSVRARVPHSPAFGFAYHSANSLQIRHLASDHERDIRSFGFTRHDGRTIADHYIDDTGVNLRTNFTYVKHTTGAGWTLTLSGDTLDPDAESTSPVLPVSVVFYALSVPEEMDEEVVQLKGETSEVRRAAGSWGFVNLAEGSDFSERGVIGDCVLDGTAPSVGGRYRVVVREPEQGGIGVAGVPDTGRRSSQGRRRRRTRKEADSDTLRPDFSRFHVASAGSSVGDAVLVEDRLRGELLQSHERNTAEEQLEDGETSRSTQSWLPTLSNEVVGDSPLLLVQRIVNVPFRMDVVFTMMGEKDASPGGDAEHVPNTFEDMASRVESFSGYSLEKLLLEKRRDLDDRLAATFLSKHASLGPDGGHAESEYFGLLRAALANVIGGIGYFYGGLVVEKDGKADLSSPRGLLSATPSRAVFPRGFLWDEGFHQLIVQRWDARLSRACLMSWLAQMDTSGWIPREQALGFEARARFPTHVKHLMVQHPSIANPPTLLMPLRTMAVRATQEQRERQEAGSTCSDQLQGVDGSCDVGDAQCVSMLEGERKNTDACGIPSGDTGEGSTDWEFVLESAKRNFDWLVSTQAGTEDLSFRWRGRSNRSVTESGHLLTLASGLDDYPRGLNPNDGERHLDLHCWVAWAAGALIQLSLASNEPTEKLKALQTDLVRAMEHYHASDASRGAGSSEGLLCDFDGVSTSCQEGYVTLLPLILGLLEVNSPRVGAILASLESEERLRSPAGVRSLSKQSDQYGQANNYWTGPVWMPFNYMTLAALREKYGSEEGPYKERALALYKSLRSDVLFNVRRTYEETGFIWENYSPEDGKGQSGRQFTGWSALVLLIYAEMYDGIM